jgi:hypothetical protein
MRAATRHSRTEAPAARAAAARDPAWSTVDAATRLDASPRQAAQRALHAAIGHAPHAAHLPPTARHGAGDAALHAPAEVVQRWPVPSVSSLLMFGGGLVATASAGAWTSLLAMGGGVAMVMAVANEAAQAYGAQQPPRGEDLATPDAILEERAENAQAQLEEASVILNADPGPQQREVAEQQAESAVQTQVEAVAVQSSKAKAKRERKKLAKAKAMQEGEPPEGKQEAETVTAARSDDGGAWFTPQKQKVRKPKKSPLEKVQQGFEQALRLTAGRDRPQIGRNNGGDVQGFSGIVPLGEEWDWLKANVDGTVYDNHGLPLRHGQSLRWYVTESSNSGASFDVSLHLYEGDTDTRTPCLVLHVPK